MIHTFSIETLKLNTSYHTFNLRNSMIAYIDDRIRVAIITAATSPNAYSTQLGYSAGEFQALQLIVLATFGVVD